MNKGSNLRNSFAWQVSVTLISAVQLDCGKAVILLACCTAEGKMGHFPSLTCGGEVFGSEAVLVVIFAVEVQLT